jgi:hypothetical protein
VEAFEVFDAVCCIDCGAAMFDADDGQPDEAQEWASFDPEC